MRYFLRIIVLLLCLIAIVVGCIAYEAVHFLQTPPQTEGQEVFFDVAPGARLGSVAEKLADVGLVTDARFFTFLARWKNEHNKLKTGRFALRTDWPPEKVLETLVHGKPVLYRITVPEGLTRWQTAKLLEDAGFVRATEFMQVTEDPSFLRHYGIPFSTAEGFLMPDTYLLKKPDNEVEKKETTTELSTVNQARKVAGRLVDTFWQKTSSLWPDRRRPDEKLLRHAVILASIVEKETAIEGERPRISGVYTNRLAKNMLLQADPTVLYGLGPGFTGRLLYKHLNDGKNPYNTYQHPGLPPGPICSFGLNSLSAALHPEQHDYLYFVAKIDGGEHVFSRRLEEHTRAVQEYRKNAKKKQETH